MTWEEIMQMQQQSQAGAQKNRAMAAQGAQQSLQEAQQAAAKSAAQQQMMGQLAGGVIGGAVGGPAGASIGSQLGGAAAGGDIDPMQLATGSVLGSVASGSDKMFGGIAGQAAMADAGIGGEQASMLEDQMKEFGMSDRMATGQFFKQGGPVKHYKGGGQVAQAVQMPTQFNAPVEQQQTMVPQNYQNVGGLRQAIQNPMQQPTQQQSTVNPQMVANTIQGGKGGS